MAQGCARIDSRLDAEKIDSAGRVEVHRARLIAVIGVRKTFPHGLGHQRPLGRSTETSAFAPCTDIVSQSDHFRKVPIPDSCTPPNTSLFDHLVGTSEQPGRNFEIDSLGGLQIDNQLVSAWSLNRKIAR